MSHQHWQSLPLLLLNNMSRMSLVLTGEVLKCSTELPTVNAISVASRTTNVSKKKRERERERMRPECNETLKIVQQNVYSKQRNIA